MFFKIGALKNFAKVKHLCWSLFLIKIKKKEAPTQLFSWEHCKIVKNSFLHRATTTSSGCFYQFGKVASCSVLGICRPSLINQNLNVGLFLLKRFVHLYRACSLDIISRNYSSAFLLINMQKANSCSKQNIAAKAICSDTGILTV